MIVVHGVSRHRDTVSADWNESLLLTTLCRNPLEKVLGDRLVRALERLDEDYARVWLRLFGVEPLYADWHGSRAAEWVGVDVRVDAASTCCADHELALQSGGLVEDV